MGLLSKTKTESKVNASLAVAFTGLTQRFGNSKNFKDITKFLDSDYNEDDWGVISDLDHTIQLKETGGYGTWPNIDNAIIKFQYQDQEEPYVEVDGERHANILDHYCLVANAGEHAIIDSADGVIKSNNPYGLPVAWASYEPAKLTEDGEVDAKSTSGRWHKLGPNESIWEVARRYKLEAKELIEHNEIADPYNLPAGTEIHLPIDVNAKPQRVVEYEILREPLMMHVTKKNGTRKQAFGNAKSWKDIKYSGPMFKENNNVEIVAIAQVPIGDETAAYYMTSTNFGDYKRTGKVAQTIGFNHSHLAEGEYEQPKPAPRPEIKEKLEEAEIVKAAMAENLPPKPVELPASDRKFVEKRLDDTLQSIATGKNPEHYKTTYKPFEAGPGVYIAKTDVRVHDFETKRPGGVLRINKGVMLTGTFEYGGVSYGRPQRGQDSWHWYGIPMHQLESEDELFTPPQFDLPTRVALKKPLTVEERGVVLLSRVLGQGTRAKAYLTKLKKKI